MDAGRRVQHDGRVTEGSGKQGQDTRCSGRGCPVASFGNPKEAFLLEVVGEEKGLPGALVAVEGEFFREVKTGMLRLRAVWAWMKNLFREEKGQGMVEYALIIAVVAIVVVAALVTMRDQLSAIFNSIATTLQNRG